MKFYRIVNWEEYQHYKDRSPPWIKLHRNLLTSETWVSSDSETRVLAIAIMMLAAATDNKIPAKPGYVRRAAYLDNDPDFEPLIEMGFIEIIEENPSSASAPQADASTLQANARPEERGGEKRREDSACDSEKVLLGVDGVVQLDPVPVLADIIKIARGADYAGTKENRDAVPEVCRVWFERAETGDEKRGLRNKVRDAVAEGKTWAEVKKAVNSKPRPKPDIDPDPYGLEAARARND